LSRYSGRNRIVFIAQNTLRHLVKAAGIGLHSGRMISVVVRPAPVNSGIRFVRTDLAPECVIPARPEYVTDTQFATTIGTDRGSVGTIEHLMAALAGAGVDNAIVEVDGPEVPAMDGSAHPFLSLFRDAGLRPQAGPRRHIEILEPVTVTAGDRSLSIRPSKNFKVSFEIDFEHPLVSRQYFKGKINAETFARHISRARTFGFLSEVEAMRENGLALGGSLANAVVMNDSAVLNDGGLRFSDEFVRHKVLDLVGDLFLLGAPILGEVRAVKSGHLLHHLLTKELLSRPFAWRHVEHGVNWQLPSWGTAGEGVIPAPAPA
jgi:UDP-3-O-[3-hydroxymyristoyl] N-acetylglucosamine deacetylase